jgi:hypothetical protein
MRVSGEQSIKRTKTVRDERSLSPIIEAVNNIRPKESGHAIVQPLKAVTGGLAIDKSKSFDGKKKILSGT